MRRVEYKKHELSGDKWEYVTHEGLFHQWGEVASQESGDCNRGGWEWITYTQAIIEEASGQIVMVGPDDIKFLDKDVMSKEAI
ncbi:MAG: hypothetical protein M0Q43_10355 [Methanothrix sp.]|jgi:hypothetical protein|nr:hypothetical protein [Methanothrix sp.]